MIDFELVIDGVHVDLFKDEDIVLEKSIKDLDDLNAIYGDRTTPFTLPATEKNNALFKHYRRVDKGDQLDAAKKIAAEIRLKGNIYSRGFIQFIGAKYKGGTPYSYQITYFNNLVGLKDQLEGATLKGLSSLDAYDHTYDEATVKTGIESGLFSGVVRYPLISALRYWQFYPGDAIDPQVAEIDPKINIGKNFGAIRYFELRPAIKLDTVWSAIKSDYNLTINSDFDSGTFWDGLYLHCFDNKGAQDILQDRSPEFFAATSESRELTSATGDNEKRMPLIVLTDSDGLYSQGDNFITIKDAGNYSFEVVMGGTCNWNAIPQVKVYKNGSVLETLTWTVDEFQGSAGTGPTTQTTTPAVFAAGDEIEFKYFLGNTSPLRPSEMSVFSGATVNLADTAVTAVSDMRIRSVIPDMPIIDFIEGLAKIYNCVLIPEVDGSYTFQKRTNWLDAGDTIDITNYVDMSEMEIKPVAKYRNIEFSYAKDQEDLLNKGFKAINKRDAGSFKYVTGADFGEDYSVECPFGYTVFTQLTDYSDSNVLGLASASFYADSEEGKSVPVETAPRIMYYGGQYANVSGTGAGQPRSGQRNGIRYIKDISAWSATNVNDNDGGTVFDGCGENTAFTYLSSAPNFRMEYVGGSVDLSFNKERTIRRSANFAIIDNNSFTDYYQEEIVGTFDNSNRLYSLKAVLPSGITQVIKLNDILRIGNALMRINKMNINLLTGETELELYHDFKNRFKRVL